MDRPEVKLAFLLESQLQFLEQVIQLGRKI
jgi:hypothetical protein